MKKKRKKEAKPKAPINPWEVTDDTTYEDKVNIARSLTVLLAGGVIVEHDPGTFVTFDGSCEDHENGTSGHIWTINPKMDAEYLNDMSLCVHDIDGGDMRKKLSERLRSIAKKFVDLAVTLDLHIECDGKDGAA